MTGFAVGCGVASDQRKAISVLAHRLNLDFPAPNRMAILASDAELTPVDIRMTRSAGRSNFLEIGVDMAGDTRYSLMKRPQWKLRLCVVVKIRRSPNRFPGGGRMTVLAGYFEASMRILLGLLCPCTCRKCHQRDYK
jgi:hypothetical protein